MPGADMADAIKSAVEDRVQSYKVELAEAKLRAVEAERAADERTKPSWLADWIKPGPILALAAVFGGQFLTYQNDKATITASIAEVRNTAASNFLAASDAIKQVSNKVDANSAAADNRAQKYIGIIEADHSGAEAQKIINDQTGDRLQNVASALADIRKSIETLRDMSERTREDLIKLQAVKQHEGRIAPGVHDEQAAVAR